jgi:hypothetical protein
LDDPNSFNYFEYYRKDRDINLKDIEEITFDFDTLKKSPLYIRNKYKKKTLRPDIVNKVIEQNANEDYFEE